MVGLPLPCGRQNRLEVPRLQWVMKQVPTLRLFAAQRVPALRGCVTQDDAPPVNSERDSRSM